MSTTCVWNMNSPCGGEASSKNMFRGQISVPVCVSHYTEHLTLMALNGKFGKDIEELLELSTEERTNLLSTLTTDVDSVLKETELLDTSSYQVEAAT